MSFNPNEHLMQLKSKEGAKDYLPVAWRIVWFREQCPNGTIETEEVAYDLDREVTVEAYVWNNEKRKSEKVLKTAKGYARFKAVVTDGKGGRATGHGSECAADFSDFGEKAETKAIGRALAGLGYGTQFAPEFDEEHRIVDAPVERSQDNSSDAHSEIQEYIGSAMNAAPEQPTPIVDAPTVKELQAKCRELFGTGQWAATVLKLCGSVIPDHNLTPEDRQKIYQSLLAVERKRQKNNKAS